TSPEFHDLSRPISSGHVASLGNWTAIENKDVSRLWCSFRTTKNPTKSLPPFEHCLNAAEMRQSFESREFGSSISSGPLLRFTDYTGLASDKRCGVFSGIRIKLSDSVLR